MAVGQAAGRRIDCVLVETGMVNEDDALKTLADALGLKFLELQGVEIDRELLAKFPTSAVFRHTILPLGRDNGKVRVATFDPFNLEALNELSAFPVSASIPCWPVAMTFCNTSRSIWASAATRSTNS